MSYGSTIASRVQFAGISSGTGATGDTQTDNTTGANATSLKEDSKALASDELYEKVKDKDGNELTLIDLLSEKEESVFAQVEKSIQREKFVAHLKKFLNDREFVILSMRYGLEDSTALPQREVAKKLGISRSYISRIEKRAIEKARENLSKDDFFTD